MGYFDLNIPYPEPSPANKATEQGNRTRLAVKAMELGYTGIAYNRTIKGVMSDHHRCSICPLTLSSLLNVLPSLSLSANLHRHLLRIPLLTPFRQYTRLTVCVDGASQAQALNSGNPILKTYDLVAVKPLNQIAFDLACERMEVDIISIDFSAKLPFRLKQSMVKAATKRGVCFEVTYSGLFADIQIRRQLISSAKLLMDWTRGQNIVFSSAAPTVNELRGPCDVANLLSLFGLSKERANAAISKNCRILLSNSVRKKRFYKEAIRVDVLSSDAASHSNKEDRYQELLKWDPISSGEDDILLDGMQKSSLVSCKASKPAKAIDFASVVDSLPSHGFQIKGFFPANSALPAFPDKEPDRLDVCPEQDESSQSLKQSYDFLEKNMYSGTTEAFNSTEIDMLTNATKLEFKKSIDSDVNFILFEAKALDSQSDLCISSNVLDTKKPYENEKLFRSSEDAKLDDAHIIDHKAEIFDIVFPTSVHDKHNNEKRSDVTLNKQNGKVEALPNEHLKIAEQTDLELNTSISDTLMEDKQFDKREIDARELDEKQLRTPYDEMKTEDDSSAAKHLLPDVIMKDKKLSEVSTDSDQFASVHSVSGGLRVKRRMPRGLPLFPFKRLLNPMPFKKKGKTSKSRTKLK